MCHSAVASPGGSQDRDIGFEKKKKKAYIKQESAVREGDWGQRHPQIRGHTSDPKARSVRGRITRGQYLPPSPI